MSIPNHGQDSVTYQTHTRTLHRAHRKLNSDRWSGRTRQVDTSTAPATGAYGTLPAGALGPRETVPHAGCRPSPSRLARSRRPLAAQAEEQEPEGQARPSGSRPLEMWVIPRELRRRKGQRRQWRKTPLLLGGLAFSGVRRRSQSPTRKPPRVRRPPPFKSRRAG